MKKRSSKRTSVSSPVSGIQSVNITINVDPNINIADFLKKHYYELKSTIWDLGDLVDEKFFEDEPIIVKIKTFSLTEFFEKDYFKRTETLDYSIGRNAFRCFQKYYSTEQLYTAFKILADDKCRAKIIFWLQTLINLNFNSENGSQSSINLVLKFLAYMNNLTSEEASSFLVIDMPLNALATQSGEPEYTIK